MDRRRDESPERRFYSSDRYTGRSKTYEVEPALLPELNKSKWKKIFSRKKGKMKVNEPKTNDDGSLPPLPSTQPASFVVPLPPQPPFGGLNTVPHAGSKINHPYDPSAPGFLRVYKPPRRRLLGQSRGGPRAAVIPLARPNIHTLPTFVRDRRFAPLRPGVIHGPGRPPMVFNGRPGGRVPREDRYASTSSEDISGTAPTRKKRSFGGEFKRWSEPKKDSAYLARPITVHPPSRNSYDIKQADYPTEEVYEPEPGVLPNPGSGSSRPAAPLVIPALAPAGVGVPAPATGRTESPRFTRSSVADMQVSITPRTSIPVRTSTGGSSTLDRPGAATAPPQIYPTGSSYGFGRRGAPIPPPRDLAPSDSESPSVRSVQGADRSWGELRLPAEPSLAAAPMNPYRMSSGPSPETPRAPSLSVTSASSQNSSEFAPTKKKHSSGGPVKRMFKRKKKHGAPGCAPPPVCAPTALAPDRARKRWPNFLCRRLPSARSSALATPAPQVGVAAQPTRTHTSRGTPPAAPSHSSDSRQPTCPVSSATVPRPPRNPDAARVDGGGTSQMPPPRHTTPPAWRYPTGSPHHPEQRGAPLVPSLVTSVMDNSDRSKINGELPVKAPLIAALVPSPVRTSTYSGPRGVNLGGNPTMPTRSHARRRAWSPTAPAPRTPRGHLPRPTPPPAGSILPAVSAARTHPREGWFRNPDRTKSYPPQKTTRPYPKPNKGPKFKMSCSCNIDVQM